MLMPDLQCQCYRPVIINPPYAVVDWVEKGTQQLAFNFGMRGGKPNL